MLDVDVAQVRIGADAIALPNTQKTIVIPMSGPRIDSDGETVASLMDIPWVGTHEWLAMYDWPRHAQPKQHESLMLALEPHLIQGRITRNNLQADEALRGVLQPTDPAKLKQLSEQHWAPEDFAPR